jgi:hypothetical protein
VPIGAQVPLPVTGIDLLSLLGWAALLLTLGTFAVAGSRRERASMRFDHRPDTGG